MNVQALSAVLGLDVGIARTGVAVANNIARIPRPLCTVAGVETLPQEIEKVVKEQNAIAVIVGLPRNLSGQDTEQTRVVREQAAKLEEVLTIPLFFTDEAMTSVKAEEELRARKKPYQRQDIDMLAATYILEDYTTRHPEVYEI